jgi:uncharacterized membrane protein YjgN (DUF898 family)
METFREFVLSVFYLIPYWVENRETEVIILGLGVILLFLIPIWMVEKSLDYYESHVREENRPSKV